MQPHFNRGDGTIFTSAGSAAGIDLNDRNRAPRFRGGSRPTSFARLIRDARSPQRRAGPISRTPPCGFGPIMEIAPLLDHIRLRLH